MHKLVVENPPPDFHGLGSAGRRMNALGTILAS